MKKSYIETIIISFLFIFSFYLWSLPYQKNRMPYGEVDAGSHFTLGDYMAQTDKPIIELPYFIDKRYGFDNFYKPHTLWYHPPYHVNFAVMQIVGGERILPIFLFNTILCSIIVLIIYFFMRKLFGFWPAILTSLLMIFSMRDILVYLWGQWPQQISYFYTPLVLYVFYKYSNSYLDGKTKPAYAYIFAVLLGVNFYLHPVGSFHTIIAIGFFSLFLFIKEKRMPFSIKDISIAIIIFIIMLGIFPLQTASVFVQMKGNPTEEKTKNPMYHDFEGLFLWFPWKDLYAYEYKTQPEPYFRYNTMNGGYWTLPLLFVGLFFILFRRKREDLLLLSYIATVYIMIHLQILGIGRPERSLAASAHVFYPLIVLGLINLPRLTNLFLKMPVKVTMSFKYFLILLFIILVFSFNFNPAYSTLKSSYSEYNGIARITKPQYEVSEWVRNNLPMEANISTAGVLSMQKDRWMRFIAMRYIYEYKENAPHADYMIIDYSDFGAIGNTQAIQQLALLEKEKMANNTLVYNKNNIKVYKLG